MQLSKLILGSKDKEGKKSKKRDTKEDDSVSRKKKKKSLLYVLVLCFVYIMYPHHEQCFNTIGWRTQMTFIL